MKAFTDYPFPFLGDTVGEEAPIREVEIVSWYGNKYVDIKVGGILADVKAGYLYQAPGRLGEVPVVDTDLIPVPKDEGFCDDCGDPAPKGICQCHPCFAQDEDNQ